MASDHSLTRRTMLQVAGAGALVLSVPSAFAAQATASAQAPAHLRRSSYLGFTGQHFSTGAGVPLVLDAIDDLDRARTDPALVDHEEAFVLRFSAPGETVLASGVHDVVHPELGACLLFLSPVDRAGTRTHFEALVDRTVRLAGALDAPEPTARELAAPSVPSAAATRAASAIGGPAPAPARARRLRVRTKAHRAHGKVVATIEFPGGGIQAASVRLRRKGRTYAKGETAVRGGRGTLTMKPLRKVSRGSYELVITATDRRGAAVSVTRSVTVR